jgi:hypothetical protein
MVPRRKDSPPPKRATIQAIALVPTDLGSAVVQRVADAASLYASSVQPGYLIAQPPLNIQGDRLRWLTQSLDDYIRFHLGSRYLTLSDLQTPGLTVAGLIQLVAARLS